MIIVVADDFSGAAEIGAIGVRHGLKTVIRNNLAFDAPVDLQVLDTNSRSTSETAAVDLVSRLGAALRDTSPAWIYKKIDSVLRGHVAAELQALLDSLNLTRALVVPANPSLGRIIRNGSYAIGGVPLHQTSFADDAEFPARSSEVLELVGTNGALKMISLPAGASLPEASIVFGDAAAPIDVARWSASVTDDVMPVGGADFFSALLQARGHTKKSTFHSNCSLEAYTSRTGLYVVGSRTPESEKSIERLMQEGYAFAEPYAERTSSTTEAAWLAWMSEALCKQQRLIITADSLRDVLPEQNETNLARLVRLTSQILTTNPVQEVIVEGGSTGSLLARTMNWQSFRPACEYAPGIVRMRVDVAAGVHLTIKPGSYPWPAKNGTA